ncbi:MAG TPA: polyprenol monophosphomannose synthase [Candidatus Nanoarchaeia archaeon]|nr:polyprenol monophosphomannose synthase [Candidatus Nanoarchaeia archaeon]
MKTHVMVPTYNEAGNIGKLLNELSLYNVDIVVVDDNSPDGTAEIVKDIMKGNDKVHLLLRKEKRGRGNAGKDGYKYCLENGADYILEMDADFSHEPRDVPRLIEAMNDADVVLGSRFAEGGSQVGRNILRRTITFFANLYIRLLLGLKVKDCNSGFRCFRREVLEGIDAGKIFSTGPDIVQEVLYKAHLKGFKIKEIPIVFHERVKGESKLGWKQLWRGYLMVLKLKYMHLKGEI